MWALALQSDAWRRHIRLRLGGSLEAVAARLGGELRPVWSGWAITAGSIRVVWRGTIWGPRTLLALPGGRETVEGLLDADAIAHRCGFL